MQMPRCTLSLKSAQVRKVTDEADDVWVTEFGEKFKLSNIHFEKIRQPQRMKKTLPKLTLAEMLPKLGNSDFSAPVFPNVHADNRQKRHSNMVKLTP